MRTKKEIRERIEYLEVQRNDVIRLLGVYKMGTDEHRFQLKKLQGIRRQLAELNWVLS